MDRGALFAVALLVAVGPAEAQVALLGGRTARIVNHSTAERRSATIRFKRDPGLTVLQDPSCPATTAVRLSAGSAVTDIALPCAFWSARRSGFKYIDPAGSAGGVRRILYRPKPGGGSLVIKLKGPNFAAFGGPVASVDAELRVGSVAHCGRFTNARRNDAQKIVLRGPSAACLPPPVCGNALREPPEQCDGADLGGQSCSSLGEGTGTVVCRADCTLDTSGCQLPPVCGNNLREPPEECDGSDLNAQSCSSLGQGTGALSCASGCAFDTSGCSLSSPCGNGTLDNGEVCDDGNRASGDCCSPTCQPEIGASCGAGTDACNPGTCNAAGQCAPAPLNCDDNNFCTSDTCDPGSGCINTAAPGIACPGDGNFCTDDICDATGACRHTPNTRVCDDGKACTVDDVCTAGACVGTFLPPWINEIDYDDASTPLSDRDEFVEIAGPAGLDLSGYQLVSVEGNQTCATPVLGPATGEAHYIATIPAGSVLPDSTGSGVGLFAACFKNSTSSQSTSTDVGAACDAVLTAVSPDSNLMNGNLLNAADADCPDGLLLLDPDDAVLDGISWEGIVPNTGTWGPAFYGAIGPPYSIPRDEGGSGSPKTPQAFPSRRAPARWRAPRRREIGTRAAPA